MGCSLPDAGIFECAGNPADRDNGGNAICSAERDFEHGKGEYIMAWIWWFLGGGIVGFFVMGIFVGGVQNEKLKEAFDEGFIAGKSIQK